MERNQIRNSLIGLLVTFAITDAYAQIDTNYIDSKTAIVKLHDTQYEGFDKTIELKKIDTSWIEVSDTIFFNDKNIFRLRRYFYGFTPVTVDSFYQHPYAENEKILTSIVISVENLFFVQSLGADNKIKSLSIQDKLHNRKEVYFKDMIAVKPGGELNFSGVKVKIDDKYFIEKISFSRKYRSNSPKLKVKSPIIIHFSKNADPEIKVLEL